MRTRSRTESKAGATFDFTWETTGSRSPEPSRELLDLDAEVPAPVAAQEPKIPEQIEFLLDTPDASPSGPVPQNPPEEMPLEEDKTPAPEDAHADYAAALPEAPVSEQPEPEEPELPENGESPSEDEPAEPEALPDPVPPVQEQGADEESPKPEEEPEKEPEKAPEPIKPPRQVDITNAPDTIAGTLHLLMERASINSRQLGERVHIPLSFIQALETANYRKLYDDGCEYYTILQNLLTIAHSLKADDTVTGRLRDMLSSELKQNGFDISDLTTPSSTRHIITDSDDYDDSVRNTLLASLPRVFVAILVAAFILAVIFSLVIPRISGTQKKIRQFNLGPLVRPAEPPPHVLSIPK